MIVSSFFSLAKNVLAFSFKHVVQLIFIVRGRNIISDMEEPKFSAFYILSLALKTSF